MFAYNSEAVKYFSLSGGLKMYESTVERTMLFDFFGELLTEKQKQYYDLHYNADLSLAEIAEEEGISRQGVWDIIRRAEATLRRAEERTGLVRRFRELQDTVARLEEDLEALVPLTEGHARELAEQIAGRVKDLKG